MTRRGLLAQVHIAAKALALDDHTYRAVLERVTGKRSAKECTGPELTAAVRELRRLGWRPRQGHAGPGRAGGRPSHISKARALWRSLWCLDEVAGDGDDALAAYAARMTRSAAQPEGIQRLQWLDAAGWNKVIKGLTGWCKRVGYETTDADIARINLCRTRLGLPKASAVHCAKIRLVELLFSRCQHAGASSSVTAISILTEHAGDDDPRPERLSGEAADAAARAMRERFL